MLKLPEITETPHHFYYNGVDLPYATCEETKVEKIGEGMIKITKSFVAKSYEYKESDEGSFSFKE